MSNNQLRFLFSVHDVAPVHLDRLILAEKLIEEFQIPEVCYLFVPNFHNLGASSSSDDFMSWCRKLRSFSVEWFQHGYYHLETVGSRGFEGFFLRNKLKRFFYTGGEGEFMALSREEIRERVNRGMEIFQKCLGIGPPYGFVAPAWFFNRDLSPCLAERGFTVTEDHRFIYNLKEGKEIKSPVITWATRTWLRRYGSVLVCPGLAYLWKKVPVIRIAVHPGDFAHSAIVDNIKRVLERAMLSRKPISYRDITFPV